jgi:uncharacterized glyoxalase superfamily protein PhnB
MTARLIPQLSVGDVDAYIAFLTQALGFEVTEYWRDPNDPSHVNVEAALGDAVIGIERADGDHVPPRELPARHTTLYVLVDDVESHYEHARAADATIDRVLSDQPWGHRMYGVIDPEGHEWFFATPKLQR